MFRFPVRLFLASFLAVQTTASRMIWSYARDKAIPGYKPLSRLTSRQKQPAVALFLATGIAVIIVILGQATPKVYELLVNFSAAGFFAAYLFPLTGSVWQRLSGRWTAGPFSLGRAGLGVAIAAMLLAALEFINIAWPRSVYPQWYLNWAVWLAVGVLAVTGAIIFSVQRPHIQLVKAADLAEDEE